MWSVAAERTALIVRLGGQVCEQEACVVPRSRDESTSLMAAYLWSCVGSSIGIARSLRRTACIDIMLVSCSVSAPEKTIATLLTPAQYPRPRTVGLLGGSAIGVSLKKWFICHGSITSAHMRSLSNLRPLGCCAR